MSKISSWGVALRMVPAAVRFISAEPLLGPLPRLDLDGIHWLIIGGESGKGARPCDPQWVRDLRDRCQAKGVAFFHKQMGTVWAKEHHLSDAKGGNWEEWPEELCIRDYPVSPSGKA